VDSCHSLGFRPGQEPKLIFLVRAGAGSGVNIKECAGAIKSFKDLIEFL